MSRLIRRMIPLVLAIVITLLPLGQLVEAKEVDVTAPVIDFAYVEDGVLKLSISDNKQLASKPIQYRLEHEYRSYEIDRRDYENLYDGNIWRARVYSIYVEIPSTVYVLVKDAAGNESSYKFTIKEDNIPLTNNVADFILEWLAIRRQSIVNRYEGFDNIFQLEYGKVVNAFSLFNKQIRENYTSYNRRDIKFKVDGLSVNKDGIISLNKYGLFKVTITHSEDKSFEETGYILIKPNWRNIEERKTTSNFSPYIIYKDKIRLSYYYGYEDDPKGKGKSKIDTTYMLVYDEELDRLYQMDEQIPLELNKIYNFKVLNFETNTQEDFYIMRQERISSNTRRFTDVDKDHWAYKDISSLVSKRLLTGYSDGSFNPSGNITVREFMTVLSRYIASDYKMGKAIVGNVKLPDSSWGYIEAKSILDRIPTKELSKFKYYNLDRPITREEVAFLMDMALDLGIPYNTNPEPLTDLAFSNYPREVKNLVDLEIFNGYPDGSFRPQNFITRAEIAAIFARMK